MKRWAEKSVRKKGSCGFVPTLGALHDGHRSLLRKARRENSRVCLSVFVNPYQFRKKQHLAYPRDLKADAKVAREETVDVLFAPEADRMYPQGLQTDLAMPAMLKRMNRQKMEWHYRAVLIVVMKLFGIVRPDRAYFGLKDPHQLALIEKMVEELNVPVKIRRCPTVRERGGLALSSRNALLTPSEKKSALVIYRALKFGKSEIVANGVSAAAKSLRRMEKQIAAEPHAEPEYLEIVDAKSLLPLEPGSKEILIYVSARIGGHRLTDNCRFRLKRP